MPDHDTDDAPLYDVRLSEPAEAEIDTLYLRLSTLSPDIAQRWHEGLLVSVASLSQFPRRCPLAPDNPIAGRELRQLLYRHGRTTYRVLFVVFDRDENGPGFVRILHVFHAAQRRPGDTGNENE